MASHEPVIPESMELSHTLADGNYVRVWTDFSVIDFWINTTRMKCRIVHARGHGTRSCLQRADDAPSITNIAPDHHRFDILFPLYHNSTYYSVLEFQAFSIVSYKYGKRKDGTCHQGSASRAHNTVFDSVTNSEVIRQRLSEYKTIEGQRHRNDR